MIEEYRRRSEEAFAPTTLRNYVQIRAMLTEWCKKRGYYARPQVTPQVAAKYVDYLGGKVKPSTIEIRLWVIGEMHHAEFQDSPCRHEIVELALKGVKRKYGAAIRQAPALGKKDVLNVIASLGQSCPEMRDEAVLWVATDSWCRASEICAFKVRDFLLAR